MEVPGLSPPLHVLGGLGGGRGHPNPLPAHQAQDPALKQQ